MSSASSSTPILLWFRQDLRVTDHRALTAAATGRPLIPVYVLDDTTPGVWRAGAASRWWLHHSLESLGRQLGALGLPLILRRGPALTALRRLLDETGADGLYCTRACEPWARRDEDQMGELGIDFRRFPHNPVRPRHDPHRCRHSLPRVHAVPERVPGSSRSGAAAATSATADRAAHGAAQRLARRLEPVADKARPGRRPACDLASRGTAGAGASGANRD